MSSENGGMGVQLCSGQIGRTKRRAAHWLSPMTAHKSSKRLRSAKTTVPGAPSGRLTYTVRETADALGVSRSTVYRLLYRGVLSSIPGLRHKLLPRSAVVAFVEQGGRHD